MKYLRKFFEHTENIYQFDWHIIAPDKLVVIKGDSTDLDGNVLDPKTGRSTHLKCEYKLGNIMSDLVHQVTYDKNFENFGLPDTLELDVAVIKNENQGRIVLNVEISFGDLIVSGFEISAPNKITLHQYTSFHSKTDPSNTVFAFDEPSLQKLLEFFNRFDSINLTRKELNFLDNNPDSYYPS